MSGFPVIRLPFGLAKFSTGFSLAVGMEAYWGYALYVWLAIAPGDRSRKFAMWSAVTAFSMSLAGQGAYHLMLARHVTLAPAFVVVFMGSLPVVVIGLTAILIHLMHADARAAEEAARKDARDAERTARTLAEAGEIAGLRAELEALRETLAATETAHGEAETRAADAEARAAKLTRKLATAQEGKGTRSPAVKKPAASSRKSGSAAPETELPDDFDAQTEALRILTAEPGISGAKLAERVGRSERWGQLFKSNLTKTAPQGIDAGEGSQ